MYENKKQADFSALAAAAGFADMTARDIRIRPDIAEGYKSYIKEIGGNNEMLNVKTEAVERLTREWQRNGLGYVIDVIENYDNGFSDVILYYGSHTYNQAQMNRLISLIVQDCKEYGIETESPAELQRLVDAWGGDADA